MNIIDTFRYLVSLEEHKHFSRAAQACHLEEALLLRGALTGAVGLLHFSCAFGRCPTTNLELGYQVAVGL